MANTPAPLGIRPRALPVTDPQYRNLVGIGRIQPLAIINVQDFGAIGDGSHDDTAALQRALDAIPDNGSVVYFPQGTYHCTNKLTCANRHIALCGAGRQATAIRFVTGNGGFDLSFDSFTQALTISDMTLIAGQAATGSGIKADWPDSGSGLFSYCLIQNVILRPNTGSTDYWTKGIELDHAAKAVVENAWVLGKDSTTTMSSGIELTGLSIDVMVLGCRIDNCNIGVKAPGGAEGMAVLNCVMVYVQQGVESSPGTAAPWVTVADCHVNAFQWGVALSNRSHSFIRDNVIYKQPSSTADFVGIELAAGCDESKIHDNAIWIAPAATGGNTGIDFNGGKGHIHDNMVYLKGDTGSAVHLASASHNCVVHANLRENGATTVQNDGSTPGAQIFDNFP